MSNKLVASCTLYYDVRGEKIIMYYDVVVVDKFQSRM